MHIYTHLRPKLMLDSDWLKNLLTRVSSQVKSLLASSFNLCISASDMLGVKLKSFNRTN